MEITSLNWSGWSCLRLRSGEIELRIPTEIGPRILFAGWVDGPNLLGLIAADISKSGGDTHRLYGGHRLWHAPEHPQRTYAPDNESPRIRREGNALILEQATETQTGIQKSLKISADESGAGFHLRHELRNTTLWPIRLAPWALTVMAIGGVGILPLPPRGQHPQDLLPNTRLIFWPYVDMQDPRWGWGQGHLRLQQDPAQQTAQKVGALVPSGWLAYVVQGCLFMKTFPYEEAARYPDDGCNAEMFVNGDFLELESLGAITELPPGAHTTHEETWFFLRDVPIPQSEADIETIILPRLAQLGLPGLP